MEEDLEQKAEAREGAQKPEDFVAPETGQEGIENGEYTRGAFTQLVQEHEAMLGDYEKSLTDDSAQSEIYSRWDEIDAKLAQFYEHGFTKADYAVETKRAREERAEAAKDTKTKFRDAEKRVNRCRYAYDPSVQDDTTQSRVLAEWAKAEDERNALLKDGVTSEQYEIERKRINDMKRDYEESYRKQQGIIDRYGTIASNDPLKHKVIMLSADISRAEKRLMEDMVK